MKRNFGLVTVVLSAGMILGCGPVAWPHWSDSDAWRSMSARRVRRVIEAGEDVNEWFEDGSTPLMRAAEANPDPEVTETLLAAGAKGKRFALPNARVMVHQPSGGYQGQAADIEIQAKEVLKLRDRLNNIYHEHTEQPLDVIEDAMDRDRYMSPDEAKEFGLIDEVVASRPVPANGDEETKSGGRSRRVTTAMQSLIMSRIRSTVARCAVRMHHLGKTTEGWFSKRNQAPGPSSAASH